MASGHSAPAFSPAVVEQHEPSLNIKRHMNYWKRCLKTYLPNQYTSNDSNRMLLAFFIVSALDLLDCLDSSMTAEERQGYIDWIYLNQHPEGGFRAFPGTDFGKLSNEQNKVWDPANVPGTFFALLCLGMLGDGLERVKRRECLQWLTKMQREDGSFGETLGPGGKIEDGMDTRFGYCGTGIRWVLRGNVEGEVEGVPDVNIDTFVQCIRKTQTYDGGIANQPFHEAHAGFAWTALGALWFVDRLPSRVETPHKTSVSGEKKESGVSNLDLLVEWLVHRQTATLDFDDEFDTYSDETDTPTTCHDAHSFIKMHEFSSKSGEESYKGRPTSHFEIQWAGFNGRCNKIADTCYSFWVGASLAVLVNPVPISHNSNRRYLLDKTQHIVGGFGKTPGDPPDAYHSYLGLAALSIFDEPGLKKLSPAHCISWDAVRKIEALPWRRNILGLDPVESTAIDLRYMSVSGG